MRLVTYYTEGVYEEIANEYIIPSSQKIGVELFQVKIPSQRSWKKNTALKASCILSTIEELNDDIVMIDADATFEKYPELLFNIPKNFEVAVHYLDTEYFWRGQLGSSKRELCSGTIMFRNSPKSKEILKRWIEENKKHPDIWEQKNLQNIIRPYDIYVYQLPIEYLAVVHRDGNVPSFIKEPVIIHHQASRRTKRMEL